MAQPTVTLSAGLITGLVVGRSGITLLARVLGNFGTPITRATISSIAWKISDLSTGLVIATGTFAVAASVFDALIQNDPRWVRDSSRMPGPDGAWGFNFSATLGAANFAAQPLVGRSDLIPADRLRCDVTFSPVSGENFVVPFEFTSIPAY